MFIKLRAKRFWGRLTVQERGAGLGDIFTQNTLTAIKVVCQVLDLSLYGHRRRRGVRQRGGGIARGDHHTSQSSAAGRPHQLTRTHAHTYMLSDAETKISSFLLTLHGEHYSHYHPAQVTPHPCQLTQLISSHSGLSCDT